MKTKVLCNIYTCSSNKGGMCTDKSIAIDRDKGCIMFSKESQTKQFIPRIPPEEDPPGLR